MGNFVRCSRFSPRKLSGLGAQSGSLCSDTREEDRQLLSRGLKRNALQRAPLRFGNERDTGIDIAQQLQRNGGDFVDRASSAAALRKRDSFNRAISAHASYPAKKRVARDLPRHAAAVQLQNDFM